MWRIERVVVLLLALGLACLVPLTADAQFMPHAVFGTVSDAEGSPVEGASVTVINLRTGESVSTTTNADGHYSADLFELPSGYQEGDRIRVRASTPRLEGSSEVTVSESPMDRCDVVLDRKAVSPVILAGIVGGLAVLTGTIIYYLRARKERPGTGGPDMGRRRRRR